MIMKPGQFFTFILPKIWWRSYSVLENKWDIAVLIIKKWEIKAWGRWWSIFLCDSKVWDEFKAVWPAWHFVLWENNLNKLFLWTWTGLVPLYNMILAWLKKSSNEKYQLVFWVRFMTDMFYSNEFAKLKELYPNRFYYHLVISRDEWEWMIKKWYVTDFLSQRVVSDYDEFYICWAPGMIEGCQSRLLELWVENNTIFFEKYA